MNKAKSGARRAEADSAMSHLRFFGVSVKWLKLSQT